MATALSTAANSRLRPTPLARGLAWRLGWAMGVSTVLWIAVWWALV